MTECELCGEFGAMSYISTVGYVHDTHLEEEPFKSAVKFQQLTLETPSRLEG